VVHVVRSGMLLSILLTGCQGEPVGAPSSDASVSDAPGDVADAVVFDASCPLSGDLVPNGAFAGSTAPWGKYNCTMALAEGSAPCGNALRMAEIADYGEVHQRVNAKVAKDARLRLRAWVRADAFSAELPPSVSVSFVRSVEVGETVVANLSASPPTTPTAWTEVTATLTLPEEASAYDVRLSSNRAHGGPPAVQFAAVSLVVEP